jgi:uncharacterized protein (UPF0264 family)
MTGILASVTSIAEARIALEAGADIIDLKNPAQGALGALPLGEIEAIVHYIDGRRPVSATIGDLPMHPRTLADAISATAATGVDIVKIGLFGDSTDHPGCIREAGKLARQGCRIVAVLFADQSPDFSLLPLLAASGFHGAMLDTANKAVGGLRSWLDEDTLREFVATAKSLNLLVGLAGSLREEDIDPLVVLGADYLGFRGALCDEMDRRAALHADRIKSVCRGVAQLQQIGRAYG